MEKVSYRELTIGFLLIMSFFLSVAMGYLSHKVDKMEMKVDYIENDIKS